MSTSSTRPTSSCSPAACLAEVRDARHHVSPARSSAPEVQPQREIDTGKPKYWEDGTPRQQIVVHLQTDQRDPDIEDDDGIRADLRPRQHAQGRPRSRAEGRRQARPPAAC